MLAELSLAELEAELTTGAAQLASAQARWLELVAEFERREGYTIWECRSTAHFLNWQCGISLRTAHDQVRVAKSMAELPAIKSAFTNGEVSYSQVRAMTRVATPETEETLLEWARHSTAAQLERIVSGRRRVSKLDAQDTAAAERLDWLYDDDGSLIVRARLTAEDGALFLAAMARAKATDGTGAECSAEHNPDLCSAEHEPGVCSAEHKPTRPVSNVEALLAMAQTMLAGGPRPLDGPDRTLVLIHVEAADGQTRLQDGRALSDPTRDRLLCDSAVAMVLRRGSEVLDLGRAARLASHAQRRALLARDGGCVFPGCDQRRFVDAHHIVHWEHQGPTNLDNLVLMCRRHHRATHDRGYVICLRKGTAEVRRPDGTLLPGGASKQRAPKRTIEDDAARLDIVIGPETPRPSLDFRPPDYGLAVSSLIYQEERTASPV